MSVLSKPYFHDEAAAFTQVEAILWPNGPVCPHCQNAERIYSLGGVKGKTGKLRHGLRKCGACRKQFTVRIGTIFEESHLPLHKWLQAIHLVCSSKKGISAHQLHRILEVQYKTAWFLHHRIREAMRAGDLSPMGGAGGIVEVDETYYGKPDYISAPEKKAVMTRGRPSPGYTNVILSLVERGGSVRSFHVDNASVASVYPIIRANLHRESVMMTDALKLYRTIGKEYAAHEWVDHSAKEWVRGHAGTQTIESMFAIFKRGMKGIYQHCSEKHLHRYLAEFDFRYNNRSALGVEDEARAERTVRGMLGKRLTYRDSRGARA